MCGTAKGIGGNYGISGFQGNISFGRKSTGAGAVAGPVIQANGRQAFYYANMRLEFINWVS